MQTISYKIVPQGKVYEVTGDGLYYRPSLRQVKMAIINDYYKRKLRIRDIKSIEVVIEYE